MLRDSDLKREKGKRMFPISKYEYVDCLDLDFDTKKKNTNYSGCLLLRSVIFHTNKNKYS